VRLRRPSSPSWGGSNRRKAGDGGPDAAATVGVAPSPGLRGRYLPPEGGKDKDCLNPSSDPVNGSRTAWRRGGAAAFGAASLSALMWEAAGARWKETLMERSQAFVADLSSRSAASAGFRPMGRLVLACPAAVVRRGGRPYLAHHHSPAGRRQPACAVRATTCGGRQAQGKTGSSPNGAARAPGAAHPGIPDTAGGPA